MDKANNMGMGKAGKAGNMGMHIHIQNLELVMHQQLNLLRNLDRNRQIQDDRNLVYQIQILVYRIQNQVDRIQIQDEFLHHVVTFDAHYSR